MGMAVRRITDPTAAALLAQLIRKKLILVVTDFSIGQESGAAMPALVFTDEIFTTPSNGFTLAHTPIDGSLIVFRNRGFEGGWTLAARLLTLADALAGNDSVLAHYAYFA